MGSIIASVLAWALGKLFGKGSEEKVKKELAETKKENAELKAEVAKHDAEKEYSKKIQEREERFKNAKTTQERVNILADHYRK